MKGWQSQKSDETAFINFLGSTLFKKKNLDLRLIIKRLFQMPLFIIAN